VGDLRIASGLAGEPQFTVKFEVNKSTAREPNTLSVQLANLNPATARRFEETDDQLVELRAGYGDLVDVIFAGDVRDVFTLRDGTERWTTIEAEDGGRSYSTAEVHATFGDGVSVSTVIMACIDAMGVGRGNAESVSSGASLRSGSTTYDGGTVLDGVAWRELDSVCRSAGLRWSVQHGVIQMRSAGQPSDTRAIRLSPSTGLLGSPTRGARDQRTHRVAIGAKAMLIPGLYPGRVVQLDSDTVSGAYLCTRTRYAGDTAGPDWYCDLELEEY